MNRRSAMILLLVTVAAVVLQASLLPLYMVEIFKPDLLLIIMVVLALRLPYGLGLPLAWLMGMVKDVFSGLYLGLNGFIFLIIFVLIRSVADRFYAESGLLFVITVCGATLVCACVNLLLLVMFTDAHNLLYPMASGFLPHLLVNAFSASLVALLPLFSSDGDVA
jgi:rod shape-determining protein MreD